MTRAHQRAPCEVGYTDAVEPVHPQHELLANREESIYELLANREESIYG